MERQSTLLLSPKAPNKRYISQAVTRIGDYHDPSSTKSKPSSVRPSRPPHSEYEPIITVDPAKQTQSTQVLHHKGDQYSVNFTSTQDLYSMRHLGTATSSVTLGPPLAAYSSTPSSLLGISSYCPATSTIGVETPNTTPHPTYTSLATNSSSIATPSSPCTRARPRTSAFAFLDQAGAPLSLGGNTNLHTTPVLNPPNSSRTHFDTIPIGSFSLRSQFSQPTSADGSKVSATHTALSTSFHFPTHTPSMQSSHSQRLFAPHSTLGTTNLNPPAMPLTSIVTAPYSSLNSSFNSSFNSAKPTTLPTTSPNSFSNTPSTHEPSAPSNLHSVPPPTAVPTSPAALSSPPVPLTYTWDLAALSAPHAAPLQPADVLRAHGGALYRLFSLYACQHIPVRPGNASPASSQNPSPFISQNAPAPSETLRTTHREATSQPRAVRAPRARGSNAAQAHKMEQVMALTMAPTSTSASPLSGPGSPTSPADEPERSDDARERPSTQAPRGASGSWLALLPARACALLLRHTGVVPHVASSATAHSLFAAVARLGPCAACKLRGPLEPRSYITSCACLCQYVKGELMLTFDGFLRLLLLLTNLPFFSTTQVRALLPQARSPLRSTIVIPGVGAASITVDVDVDVDVPVGSSRYASALVPGLVAHRAAVLGAQRSRHALMACFAELLRAVSALRGDDMGRRLQATRASDQAAAMEAILRQLSSGLAAFDALMDVTSARTMPSTASASTLAESPLAQRLGTLLAETLERLPSAQGLASLVASSLAEYVKAHLESDISRAKSAVSVQSQLSTASSSSLQQDLSVEDLLAQCTALLRGDQQQLRSAAATRLDDLQRLRLSSERSSHALGAGNTAIAAIARKYGLRDTHEAKTQVEPAREVSTQTRPQQDRGFLQLLTAAVPLLARISELSRSACIPTQRTGDSAADGAGDEQRLNKNEEEALRSRLSSQAWPLLEALVVDTKLSPADSPDAAPAALPTPSTATARRLEVLLYVMDEHLREHAATGFAKNYASGAFAGAARSNAPRSGPGANSATAAVSAGALLDFRGYLIERLSDDAREECFRTWSQRAAALIVATHTIRHATDQVSEEMDLYLQLSGHLRVWLREEQAQMDALAAESARLAEEEAANAALQRADAAELAQDLAADCVDLAASLDALDEEACALERAHAEEMSSSSPVAWTDPSPSQHVVPIEDALTSPSPLSSAAQVSPTATPRTVALTAPNPQPHPEAWQHQPAEAHHHNFPVDLASYNLSTDFTTLSPVPHLTQPPAQWDPVLLPAVTHSDTLLRLRAELEQHKRTSSHDLAAARAAVVVRRHPLGDITLSRTALGSGRDAALRDIDRRLQRVSAERSAIPPVVGDRWGWRE